MDPGELLFYSEDKQHLVQSAECKSFPLREQLARQRYQYGHLWALLLPWPPATAAAVTVALSSPTAGGKSAIPKQISLEKTAEARTL